MTTHDFELNRLISWSSSCNMTKWMLLQISHNFELLTFPSTKCVTNHARQTGIQSSLHMPDKVLNFVKDHFLMDSVIRSAPLLLKRSVRYTQIAVHKIQGMERAYDVLFIGTGAAWRGGNKRPCLKPSPLNALLSPPLPPLFQMTESFTRPSTSTIRCTS